MCVCVCVCVYGRCGQTEGGALCVCVWMMWSD